jgi:hypothetical protein
MRHPDFYDLTSSKLVVRCMAIYVNVTTFLSATNLLDFFFLGKAQGLGLEVMRVYLIFKCFFNLKPFTFLMEVTISMMEQIEHHICHIYFLLLLICTNKIESVCDILLFIASAR